MVVADLSGKLVFLDTSPLIYFIEGHSQYHEKLKELFVSNDKGNFKFVSSVITLLEVLVKPLKAKENKIVDQYKTILLNAKGIDIFDITIPVTIKGAEPRAKYNLRTPDAL